MTTTRTLVSIHNIPAAEIQVGDLLGSSLKSRVTATLTRNGFVTLAFKTRGARSGSIARHAETETVRVWRLIRNDTKGTS